MEDLDFSLDRLSLCNFLRQFTDSEYPITIYDIQKFQKIFRRIRKIILKNSDLKINNPLIRLFSYAITFFCYILIDSLMLVSLNKKYVKQSYRKYFQLKITKNLKLSSDFTAFAFSAEDEKIVIKTCFLLYLLHYYSASVDLLIKRMKSGLPSEKSKYWLSFCLEQIDDSTAAKKILSSIKMLTDNYQPSLLQETQIPSKNPTVKSCLKFGLIIITLEYSDIFKSCLISLLKSDYEGDIIVVEQGSSPNRTCEKFCKKFNVKYLKNSDNINIAHALNLAIQDFGPEIKIVIHSHSDVLFPSKWFIKLESAWLSVIELKKVYMINLGYWEYERDQSAILDRLFILGQYENLVYIFNKLFEVNNIQIGINLQNIQNDDLTQTFGLGKDRFNNAPNELFFVAGRYSPVASFIVEAWTEINGFDTDMSVGCDLEIQLYGSKHRKWSLWINNPPFIHRRRSDTGIMSKKDCGIFGDNIAKTYKIFQHKYGFTIDHFISTYFAEILIIYQDEIIKAVNEFNFESIDFIFDKLHNRFLNKTLKSCEIIHCNGRKTCSRHSLKENRKD